LTGDRQSCEASGWVVSKQEVILAADFFRAQVVNAPYIPPNNEKLIYHFLDKS